MQPSVSAGPRANLASRAHLVPTPFHVSKSVDCLSLFSAWYMFCCSVVVLEIRLFTRSGLWSTTFLLVLVSVSDKENSGFYFSRSVKIITAGTLIIMWLFDTFCARWCWLWEKTSTADACTKNTLHEKWVLNQSGWVHQLLSLYLSPTENKVKSPHNKSTSAVIFDYFMKTHDQYKRINISQTMFY